MYKSYWAMTFNPFDKSIAEKDYFATYDYTQASARLNFLTTTKGIGLFTGNSGMGKTYVMRCFTKSLNKSLYKVIYIPLSTVTVAEFYRALSYELGLEPCNKKIDNFRNIQSALIKLANTQKITPVIILDEAQYLKTEILNDIKLLLNFEMDSKSPVILLLTGQPMLNIILNKQVHEALKQRIVINYTFGGIQKGEVEEYITSRLNLCGVSRPIFNPNSYEALASCCNGSIRKLNSLIEKCLILGYQKELQVIDTEIVMSAQNDIELVC